MKFIISRTSDRNGTPCEGAVQQNYIRVVERAVDDPRKLKSWDRGSWYESGMNHRVENGNIKKDFVETDYFIEINTLEELIEFSKKHGELVFGAEHWLDPTLPYIEIYDERRE